jgi:ABC-2 type transport system permease protein
MGKIFTLAAKDLKLLIREKVSLFWVIMFPLLIALFFGSIFSGSGGSVSGMKIAVIDEDQSDFSSTYVEELKSLDALRVNEMPRDSAIQQVRTGKLSAYIILKSGFGKRRGLFSDKPLVEVGIDPSRQMESGYLHGLLTRAVFTSLQKQFGSSKTLLKEIDRIESNEELLSSFSGSQRQWFTSMLGDMRALIKDIETEESADSAATDTAQATQKNAGRDLFAIEIIPVTREYSGPRSSFEVTFPSALIWALIGCAAAFAVSIVKERTAGTFLRLRLAPIGRAHILAGKGLACFVACLSVCIILLLIGFLIFNVRIMNPAILIIGLVSAAFCFVGLMMLISVMGKTEESVGGAAWGILLAAAMSRGGMIPVIFMPGWLLTISNFSPVKWSILAIEGGIWRGFTYSEMLLPVGMLLGIGILCYSVGVTILSRSDN